MDKKVSKLRTGNYQICCESEPEILKCASKRNKECSKGSADVAEGHLFLFASVRIAFCLYGKNIMKQFLFSVFFFAMYSAFGGSYFLALELPPDVTEQIIRTQKFIQHHDSGGKAFFTDSVAQNLHITLQEIGELSENRISDVTKAVEKAVSKFHPFSIASCVDGASFHVLDGYLVYSLKHSEILHLLVAEIRKELKLHNVPFIEKRYEFPKDHQHGHISIGKFHGAHSDYLKKTFADPKSKTHVRHLSCKTFSVTFVVLKHSNAPKSPRRYRNYFVYQLK